jgi:signal transduction histidine kinase
VGIAAGVRRSSDVLLAVALAIAIGAAAWQSATVEDGLDPLGVLQTAVAVALALSLAVRRRWPMAALVLGIATALATPDAPMDAPVPVVLAQVVATYSVGANTTRRMALIGAFGVAALVTIAAVRDLGPDQELNYIAVPALVLGTPWLAGVSVRTRTEREIALEQARIEQAGQAVADVRARIARDLHDSVAHAMSIVVLQARGARRVLEHDPQAATEALDVIESTASVALAEMRSMVDVLREPGDAAALAPPPSLRHLEPLVARVRDAGLPVDVTIEGVPVTLPPGMDAAAYRIVQEALTNALAHAGPATASVVIRYDDDRLELEIGDTGVGSGRAGATGRGHDARADRGRGLDGMRERVARLDGRLEAGPRPGGGFLVRADLPLHATLS